MTDDETLNEMKKLYPKDLQELIGGIELEAPQNQEEEIMTEDPLYQEIDTSMVPITRQKYDQATGELAQLRRDKTHQNALIDGNRRSAIEKRDLAELSLQEWADNDTVIYKKPSMTKNIISDYKWPIIIGLGLLFFLAFQGSPTVQGDINQITSSTEKLLIVSASSLIGFYLFLRARSKRSSPGGTP